MTKTEAVYNLRNEGLSYREIAKRVGSTPNVVGVLLAYGRNRVAQGKPLAGQPGRPRKQPKLSIATLDYPRKTQADIQAWWKARGF